MCEGNGVTILVVRVLVSVVWGRLDLPLIVELSM